MSRRKMHRHSLDAYVAGRVDLFPARSRAILSTIEAAGVPMTDRGIMLALKFTDPNRVRPRVTELVGAGVLREVGEQRDPETGRPVRLVDLAVRGGSQIPLL